LESSGTSRSGTLKALLMSVPLWISNVKIPLPSRWGIEPALE
jgi:hypothetical protein